MQIELIRWDLGEDVLGDGEILRSVLRAGDTEGVSPSISTKVDEPVAQVDGNLSVK